jgi:hypothetical protein
MIGSRDTQNDVHEHERWQAPEIASTGTIIA